VHADVEARVRDPGGEHDEERCRAREECGEHRCARDGGRRVPGREGVAVRDLDERAGVVGPRLADGRLDDPRDDVGDRDRGRGQEEG
jgi:hypothetical protein